MTRSRCCLRFPVGSDAGEEVVTEEGGGETSTGQAQTGVEGGRGTRGAADLESCSAEAQVHATTTRGRLRRERSAHPLWPRLVRALRDRARCRTLGGCRLVLGDS